MKSRQLNIVRSQLEKLITSYNDNIRIIDIQTKSKYHTVYMISLNETIACLNIHSNHKGTTKIIPSKSPRYDSDLCMQLVSHIEEHGEMSSLTNITLTLKNFEKDNFDLLIQYLSECNVNKHDVKDNGNSIKHIFHSVYDDSIHITYYHNSTLLLQGKPLYLFSESLQILSDLLPQNKYLGVLLESGNFNIDIGEVKSELETKCANSIKLFGNTIKNILYSAIVLRNINFESTDYSFIAFPALKGLEAYLIILLGKNKIEVSKAKRMSRCFAGDESNMYLRPEFKPSDQKLLNAIEKCYNYYKLQRHGLFHIDGIPEGSRIIEKRSEAIEIVDIIFELIESTYKEIIS